MTRPILDPGQFVPRYASARGGLRHLFVRDLVLEASIGVYETEKGAPQRVRINVDLAVEAPDKPFSDEIAGVVSYEPIVTAAKEIVAEGHVNLVETLAERLIERCLANPRVHRARVRVEKLDIFPEATSVGVEIERERTTG